jgi:hypothetical protein
MICRATIFHKNHPKPKIGKLNIIDQISISLTPLPWFIAPSREETKSGI